MEYSVIGKEEAEAIRGFIGESEYMDFMSSDCRYALCALDEDNLYGVGLFDARNVTDIRDVIVSDRMKGKLEGDIIRNIDKICNELKSSAVTMDVYDEDGAYLYDDILTKEGYTHVHTSTIYSFKLTDLAGSPILNRAKPGDHIIPLDDATDKMKKAFSKELSKAGAYDHFLSKKHDPFLSVVCVEDGAITGCVLTDMLEDGDGVELAYLYSKNDSNPARMVEMLSAAGSRANESFFSPDAVVYVTAMNEVSDSLVDRIVPNALVEDHINRYVKLLSD